jgi:hypothetical protein
MFAQRGYNAKYTKATKYTIDGKKWLLLSLLQERRVRRVPCVLRVIAIGSAFPK